MRDYSERGRELEDYSFLDFSLDTYPERKHVDNPRNQRVHFIEGSGRECQAQVVRSPGHETLPSFLGPWFPRNDDARDRGFYCASMMALLTPWRKLQEIEGKSFEASFDVWKGKTAQSNLDVMENIQFYHDASQRANKCRQEDPQSFQKEPDMDKHLD